MSYGNTQATQRWNILALRVEFPGEVPDDPTTTGDGTFDLRSFSEAKNSYSYPYDTPPHDRQYFLWHLQALANYYRTVSNGNIEIEFDVWPAGQTSSYKLPKSLIYYGSGRNRKSRDTKLVELFKDAITLADSVEGNKLDFSKYNSFLVVHAGIGSETGLLNDVSSAFLTAQDLKTYNGGPVYVDNGAHTVTDGWILPEAESTNGKVGLNGLVAKMFGYQLGLPALSNLDIGLPAIGGWSLMDSGSMNFGADVYGYLTPHLIAWCKILLGWIKPLEIVSDTTVRIAATDLKTDLPKAVKIPVGSDEYFLLENRMSRYKSDEKPKIVFSNPDNSTGVWLSVDQYDSFLPGSGILIWHIDEKVIREKWATNQIESDPFHRGIDLEEADGYKDIGNPNYGIFSSRTDQMTGGPNDPFYVGNRTIFSDTTLPDSRSYSESRTGVSIIVESQPSDTMTVRIVFEKEKKGWPQRIAGSFGRIPPKIGDLDGDGKQEVVAATVDSRIYAWRADGTPFFNADSTSGLFASIADSILAPFALGDLDHDGNLEVIATDASGNVKVWKPDDKNGDGLADLLFETRLPAAITTPVLIADIDRTVPGPEIVLGTVDGRIYVINITTGILWDMEIQPRKIIIDLALVEADNPDSTSVAGAIADGTVFSIADKRFRVLQTGQKRTPSIVASDIDLDGRTEVVILDSVGEVKIIDGLNGQVKKSFSIQPDDQIFSSPILGDIDGDSYLEIVVSGMDKIFAFKPNGIPVSGFPVQLPVSNGKDKRLSPPIMADLAYNSEASDKDNQTEISRLNLAFGTTAQVFYALDAQGDISSGFPIPTIGSVLSSPFIADLEGDGKTEIGAATDKGYLHIWELDKTTASDKVIWPMGNRDVGNTNAYPRSLVPPKPAESPVPLLKGAYCYPNPVNGNSAILRFFLSEKANINVKIFNTSGELVHQIRRTDTIGQSENEIIWDVSKFSSGFYICRIEADGSKGKKVAFVKVAVSK